MKEMLWLGTYLATRVPRSEHCPGPKTMGHGRLDTWSGPSQGWTTVFSGPLAEALVCRGLLEANGIPTQVLNETLGVIDPFIVGPDSFSVHLQAPEAEAGEAREMLAWRPDATEEVKQSSELERVRVEQLGRRIHWASITLLTAPYALWLAPRYLREVRALGSAPKNYGWTLAAIVFSTLMTIVQVATIGIRAVEHLVSRLAG